MEIDFSPERKMADPPSQPPQPNPTTLTDVDIDSLGASAIRLSLQDISNMAMTCKYLKTVAYSDYIWQSFFSSVPRLGILSFGDVQSRGSELRLFLQSLVTWKKWPLPIPYNYTTSGRDAYLARRTAVRQLKFEDPLVFDVSANLKFHDQLLLSEKGFIASEIKGVVKGNVGIYPFRDDHHARISCMRLFSINDNSESCIQGLRDNTVLVSASHDHSIRLWWKGCYHRCFRGHNGEVTTLSDKLLGDGNGTIFASGGSDGTVRLWSLIHNGKHGKTACRATLYGHDKPIFAMCVAGHKPSLQISISRDSKVRVWDTTNASSAVRSGCCVGTTSVGAGPVGMKCYDSLLYVAAGSSVVSVDIRTMREVFTVNQPEKLHSFDICPSKPFICTGGSKSASLWDIRRSCNSSSKAKPVHVFDSHTGPVKHLHIDAYKVVTGGPVDSDVYVWEPDTGKLMNSLKCSPDNSDDERGCAVMAVKGSRIVTASNDREGGVLRYRDFKDAACLVSVSSDSTKPGSKFWDSQSGIDDKCAVE